MKGFLKPTEIKYAPTKIINIKYYKEELFCSTGITKKIMLITIFFVLGKEIVLDIVYVYIHNGCILKFQSHFFTDPAESFIKSFCNIIMDTKASNLI